jgi:LuxR family maltose regulon positive regulatory protein
MGRPVNRAPSFGFEISEAKLRPVPARPGIVPRSALLDRLEAVDAPVVTIVAPPGYGKSTLLAQIAAAPSSRAAWVALDGQDNDPAVLLAHLAVALDRIEPLGAAVHAALDERRPTVTVVSRLLTWAGTVDEPFVLAIDNADELINPEAVSVVSQLAAGLSFEHRLVVASREALRWPTARLRVRGRIHEVGAADLALDRVEAMALLEQTGIPLDAEEVAALAARSEGWAAGLYLTALAVHAGGAPSDDAVATPGGDHPYLRDYLRSELLERLSVAEVEFLTRTSILDRLSGPLCDATLEATGSNEQLEHLAARNLFLLPVDSGAEWYRCHQLFRELLRTELDRREPGLVPELHRRAAAWYEEDGAGEAALDHAQAAGDVDRTLRLLHELMQPVWASGRSETVLGWLQWLADEDLMASHPELAVHGALMYALIGRPTEAERWADEAERSTADPAVANTTLADGSSMASQLAYLRAFLCRDGLDAMRTDAVAAYAGLSPASPYRASMLYAEGVALVAVGQAPAADPVLTRALDAALAIEAVPLAAMVLAERAIIAVEADDWTEAAGLMDQAVALVGDGRFDEYWTSALVFAIGARTALQDNDVPRARALLARAARLRPLLTYALPVVSVQALAEMARCYLALADPDGARAVLRQARDILVVRPDLGALEKEIETMRSSLDGPAAVNLGGSSLTAAELRLVPYLATHLSLKEIGDRLFVSRNTVKSQAISVYRKLGVSSRSEAIERLEELGLLVA